MDVASVENNIAVYGNVLASQGQEELTRRGRLYCPVVVSEEKVGRKSLVKIKITLLSFSCYKLVRLSQRSEIHIHINILHI